jgi:glutaredoxin
MNAQHARWKSRAKGEMSEVAPSPIKYIEKIPFGDLMITIYKSPSCSRCDMLIAFLDLHKLEYEVKLIDAEALTEFRINGIFDLEAPIVKIELTGYVFWYMPKDLFKDGWLIKKNAREIFNVIDGRAKHFSADQA